MKSLLTLLGSNPDYDSHEWGYTVLRDRIIIYDQSIANAIYENIQTSTVRNLRIKLTHKIISMSGLSVANTIEGRHNDDFMELL